MSDLRVVPFTGGNLHDIPAALRNVAELIESGAVGAEVPGITDATHAVWITTNGGVIEVGALGPGADKFKAIGLLFAAAAKLSGD